MLTALVCLAVAAVLILLAYRQLEKGAVPVERVIGVENPDTGERLYYTVDQAREEIAYLEGRRARLLERLDSNRKSTPKQRKRWEEAYREAVACTAVIDGLSGALEEPAS